MSMEINGNYYDVKNYSAKDPVKEKAADHDSDKPAAPQDEYVNGQKSDAKPSGLYRVGQDENGNRKIFYDDPNKSKQKEENGVPKAGGGKPGKPAERCVGNTDAVDREIQKLKDKKKQLEQEIQAACDGEKKTKELEKKLAQVENELSQKDNDAYRRQHTSFTEI